MYTLHVRLIKKLYTNRLVGNWKSTDHLPSVACNTYTHRCHYQFVMKVLFEVQGFGFASILELFILCFVIFMFYVAYTQKFSISSNNLT